jgi:hypothetical protein
MANTPDASACPSRSLEMPENSDGSNSLLYVLIPKGRLQSRVRSAVRAILTLGLQAPVSLPASFRHERENSVAQARPIFMISGCRARHGY